MKYYPGTRGPRIAKPHAGLTPEENAARFVLAWERRMIRNGRAYRQRNPVDKDAPWPGPIADSGSTLVFLRPPAWTRHPPRLDDYRWLDGSTSQRPAVKASPASGRVYLRHIRSGLPQQLSGL